VKTYTRAINDLDAGRLPKWTEMQAPDIGKFYWRLEKDANMRDLLLAVRADEACEWRRRLGGTRGLRRGFPGHLTLPDLPAQHTCPAHPSYPQPLTYPPSHPTVPCPPACRPHLREPHLQRPERRRLQPILTRLCPRALSPKHCKSCMLDRPWPWPDSCSRHAEGPSHGPQLASIMLATPPATSQTHAAQYRRLPHGHQHRRPHLSH